MGRGARVGRLPVGYPGPRPCDEDGARARPRRQVPWPARPHHGQSRRLPLQLRALRRGGGRRHDAGGRLHDAGGPPRGDGRLHQHRAHRRLSRRRAAGSDLRRRAHGRFRRARDRHGPGRAAAAQLRPAGGHALQDRHERGLRQRPLRPAPRRGARAGRPGRVRRAQGGLGEGGQAARLRLRLLHRGLRLRRRRRGDRPHRPRRRRYRAGRQPIERPGPRDRLCPDRRRQAGDRHRPASASYRAIPT